MLSAAFEKVLSMFTLRESRKRRLPCRDSSDDDDSVIDVVITSPKRMRVSYDDPIADNSSVPQWKRPFGNIASWISMSKRSFIGSYFARSIDTVNPSHRQHPSHDQQMYEEITIDDDDEQIPEITVIPKGSPVEHGSNQGQKLIRPPLSRRSEARTHERGKFPGSPLEQPFSRISRANHEVPRRSESRNSSQDFVPIYDKIYSKNSPALNSSRVFEVSGQENRQKAVRNSTLNQSIRLQEREKYCQLLRHYTSCTMGQASGLEWPARSVNQSTASQSKFDNSIATKKSGPVLQEKLDNTFKQDIKNRLHRNSTSSDCIPVLEFRRPVQEFTPEVKWLRTTNKSPDIKVIERKIPPAKERANVKSSAAKPDKDIEIITLSPNKSKGSSFCKLLENGIYESPYMKESYITNLTQTYKNSDELFKKKIEEEKIKLQKFEAARDAELRLRLKDQLSLKEIPEIDDEEEVEEVEKLIELTPDMVKKIKAALHPSPPNEVLVEAFRLKITRRDMETLNRDNWLNDEVINFYFTLIAERGKMDNYPSAHVCNTFFYPKLISSGHASLKRWTRSVDIFAHDFMFVPVHLGVHWCLAVVDFRDKKISYYDSMGGKNQQCLNALKGYLEAESLDKKKVKLDTSKWVLEIVKDKPNQLNGSDCGMFTCKYAEYISRNAKITFTQEDMPYFRHRMVYEILTTKLL